MPGNHFSVRYGRAQTLREAAKLALEQRDSGLWYSVSVKISEASSTHWECSQGTCMSLARSPRSYENIWTILGQANGRSNRTQKEEKKREWDKQRDFCFGGGIWAGKRLPTSWHVRLIYRTGLDHEAAELRTNTWQRCAWEHSLGGWLLPDRWRGLLQEGDKPASCLSVCFYLPVWTWAPGIPQVFASHGNLHYTLKSEMLLYLCSVTEGNLESNA